MVISSAGAEGIDLFSKRCSTILFLEREWTPAIEEQAEARLHRMGQKNPVKAYYFVAKDTIDEKFDSLVAKKRELIGQVVNTDDVIREVLEQIGE